MFVSYRTLFFAGFAVWRLARWVEGASKTGLHLGKGGGGGGSGGGLISFWWPPTLFEKLALKPRLPAKVIAVQIYLFCSL